MTVLAEVVTAYLGYRKQKTVTMKNLTKVMAIALIGLQTLASSGGENTQKLSLKGLKTIEEKKEQVKGTLSFAQANACDVHRAEKLTLPLSNLIQVEENPEVTPAELKVGVYSGGEITL